MKKKLIIELFIYIIVVVVGLILLWTGQPQKQQTHLNADFNMTTDDDTDKINLGGSNATIPVQ